MEPQAINDLIKLLGKYKEDGARIKALEIMLDQIEGPSDKLTASYGEQEIKGKGPVIDLPELAEYKERLFLHNLLDVALGGLEDVNKDLVTLRHIEKKNDWYILYDYLPEKHKFSDGTPMRLSERTLNRRVKKSLKIMVGILHLDLNYKNPTKFNESGSKMAPFCQQTAIK